MPQPPTIKVVVPKRKLLADLNCLTTVVTAYDQLLEGEDDGGAWEPRALALVKEHHQQLSDAQVTVKSVELVCAVLREVLGRLGFERVVLPTAALPAGNGSGNGAAIPWTEAGPAPAEAREVLERLIAQVGRIARNAPLALQEQTRLLLLCSLSLFRAVLDGEEQGTREAMTQINLLTSTRESRNLVREIALIARSIYDTLNALSEGIPVIDQLTDSSEGISEAARKLKGVVSRLEEAAFGNLDLLERLATEAGEDEQDCVVMLEALRQAQQKLGELKVEHPDQVEALSALQDRLGDDLGAGAMLLQAQVRENREGFMSLTANQSFQDLTGQTLKKTITFIETLELQLLELLKTYRPVLDLHAPRPAPAEPPPAAPEAQGKNQDEVDALLADLGF